MKFRKIVTKFRSKLMLLNSFYLQHRAASQIINKSLRTLTFKEKYFLIIINFDHELSLKLILIFHRFDSKRVRINNV